MTTQDPRWTPEAAEVVTAAIRKHTDQLVPASPEAAANVACNCGEFTYELPTHDWAPVRAAYRLHQAEAVLGALADAGLLAAPQYRDGLVVYPKYLSEDNIRVTIEHPRPSGCGWSISFAGLVELRNVAWPRFEAALREHDQTCHLGSALSLTEVDGSQT
jgi:hypothetical protein